MRGAGVTGLLIYCSDYRCHHLKISADPWPDDMRLSDLGPRFVCKACGTRGADIRPNFAPARMGTRGSRTGSLRSYVSVARRFQVRTYPAHARRVSATEAEVRLVPKLLGVLRRIASWR